MFLMAKNMSRQAPDDFWPWFDSRLQEMGLSDNQLAQKAGISHTVISKARGGYQGIGWDAGVAIAKALNLPPEVILKKLGLLPASTQERQRSALIDEMHHIFPDLSEADQEELLQMARLKLERRKKEVRGKKGSA
jgi:transcriptional regulator with XRE-family HTH domain